MLLPFTAAYETRAASASTVAPLADAPLRSEGATVRSGSLVAVAMGDAHMRLTVNGRLLESATVGSEVEVQLAALQEGLAQPGDAVKHVHGRLTAADRVEVQP